MNESYNMTSTHTIEFAKELTVKAVENGLITQCSDSEDTAKEITKFYRTVLETINQQ